MSCTEGRLICLVHPAQIDALFDKIDELGISLSDVDEKFVRGSGAGGQKINKTSSNVQMTHQRE